MKQLLSLYVYWLIIVDGILTIKKVRKKKNGLAPCLCSII